jgi:hypothetical protein
MWFKLTYSLQDMYLRHSTDAPMQFEDSATKGELILWIRAFDDKSIRPQLCCDALLERSVTPHLGGMFDLLAKRILPQDVPPLIELPHQLSFKAVIDTDGRIPDNWAVPLEIMPRRFQEFGSRIHHELADLARRFIKTIRWMQRTSGKQSPFAHVSFQWSTDKVSWQAMPYAFHARILFGQGIDTSQSAVNELKQLWLSGQDEPLAHELIREAMDVFHTNPRSALLIGVTAIETGLKRYIQLRVPKSEIILEKMPSPPTLTMLQEVIPALHKSIGEYHPDIPLQKKEADFFKKWITQRNQVAHGTKTRVDTDELSKFLEFVRAVLYRLDVCAGHAWAASFTSIDHNNDDTLTIET